MTKPKAETIFFMHRDGTLLNTHSRVPPEERDEKLFSRLVQAITEEKFKAYEEGEHIHKLHYKGHDMILEDSNHIFAAVVIAGEEHEPIMYKEILRFLERIEHRHRDEFDNWTGDKSVLADLDQYSDALFKAMDMICGHCQE